LDDEKISKVEALVLTLCIHVGLEVLKFPVILLGLHRTDGDSDGHPKKNNGFSTK
jgi:hypothetical protein